MIVAAGDKEKVRQLIAEFNHAHKKDGVMIRYIEMKPDYEGQDFYKFSVDISGGISIMSID
jgi:hypothetical protein